MRILVHTPISNRAWVLPEFLAGLRLQDFPHKDMTVQFDVNDCVDETLPLLRAYEHESPFTIVIQQHDWPPLNMRDHQWSAERYRRMIYLRNGALASAKSLKYDAIFSLDSDVILRDASILRHLIESGAPLIAGVFLAQWGNPEALPLPNVWERGQFEMTDAFLKMIPAAKDHVSVGGLGACTLIRSQVWEAGVNYSPIYNLPSNYRGEDRNFCLRAAVAGFPLWACAHTRIDHLEQQPKVRLT